MGLTEGLGLTLGEMVVFQGFQVRFEIKCSCLAFCKGLVANLKCNWGKSNHCLVHAVCHRIFPAAHNLLSAILTSHFPQRQLSPRAGVLLKLSAQAPPSIMDCFGCNRHLLGLTPSLFSPLASIYLASVVCDRHPLLPGTTWMTMMLHLCRPTLMPCPLMMTRTWSLTT